MNICADDYGLDPNINSAIIKLIELKKITSVSVLIKKCNIEDVGLLKSQQVRIGLHLDLFKTKPLINYLKYMLSQQTLVSEINEQLRLFELKFGFFPHYIDGHMHCQIYPFIRSPFIRTISAFNTPTEFYVRSCTIPEVLKKTVTCRHHLYLALLAYFNKGFVRLLRRYKVNTNKQLYGAFNGHIPIDIVFESFKSNGKDLDLFFFHPSIENIQLETSAGLLKRKYEYEYIAKN